MSFNECPDCGYTNGHAKGCGYEALRRNEVESPIPHHSLDSPLDSFLEELNMTNEENVTVKLFNKLALAVKDELAERDKRIDLIDNQGRLE